MTDEQENVRAALAGPTDAETNVALAGASFWFWYYAGRFSEGRARLESALTTPAAAPCARAKALAGAGCMALMLNDYDAARAHLTESVTLCRDADDVHSLGLSLFLLGMMHTYAGDLGAGKGLAEEALALSRAHGSRVIVGYCLVLLGLHAGLEGDDNAAEALLLESLSLGRALRNRPHIGTAQVRLGDVYQRQGRAEDAWAAYQEALTCARGGESALTLARCLHGLAGLWAARGAWERAAALLGATDALFERMGAAMPAFEAAAFARSIAAARAALSPAAFQTAWAAGQTLPLETAHEAPSPP